ncbi:unnamed protein product [Heligmosomoides polygyrus]|uniref:Coatomer subunit zeta n=1 Tax=Heligmosomoides polygyrus TaxID=6339 RepID=A0A183GVP3_HELPZ|nr:unnamed protein product [Heligmosomoides polygyrus]
MEGLVGLGGKSEPGTWKFAFKQLERVGAVLTTSECVILSLLKDAAHPKFKEVQKLIMVEAPDSSLMDV